MRLLLISNGNGEDRIAAALAQAWIKQEPQTQISALALVGQGEFYRDAGIPLLTPRFSPPSQGFAYLHPRLLWRDLRAGLGSHLSASLKALCQSPAEHIVAVGDIVPLLAALWAARSQSPKPQLAFVACALSDYYLVNRHGNPKQGATCFDPLQLHLLKKHRIPTFFRDALTAQNLRQRGIQAHWEGNPMLDCLTPLSAPQISLPELRMEASLIGLLPGSRRDAPANLAWILQQIQPLRSKTLDFWLPVSPQLQPAALESALKAQGWLRKAEYWSAGDCHLWLLEQTAFGPLLERAELVIGLAGTANEQAVGYGVPVLSFAGPEGVQQYTWAFGEAQQRLLGSGLSFLGDPHPQLVSWHVQRMLREPAYRRAAQQVAAERFGQPGASARLVRHLLKVLNET